MKRVMIVDDEFLVRVGIKSMLDWEKAGYTIVAEASDGREAIEKVGRFKPHIILTDLMMEPVGGLDLIRYCAANYPDAKIVALSNYNDFENVKTAMKLGACDFLFKLTTDPEGLLGVLDGVSREIDERALLGAGAGDLLSRNASAIQQRLIGMMIASSYGSEDELLEELKLVDVKCDFRKPYSALFMAVANYRLFERGGDASGHKVLAVSLENIIGELANWGRPAHTFRLENGQYLAIANADPAEPRGRFEAAMEAEFARIAEYVGRYFGLRISGALSGQAEGAAAVPAALAECRAAMNRAFFQNGAAALLRSAAAPGIAISRNATSLPAPDLAALRLALENAQFEEAASLAASSIERWRGFADVEPYAVREKIHELYGAVKADGLACGIELDRLADANGLPLCRAIFEYDLLDDIRESFAQIMARYGSERAKLGGRKVKREIARILAYVQANLSRELSVSEAAGIAAMSESYFSHLFKSEMGVCFVDYVNKARVERAKELLAGTDQRVNEIAASVGIANSNYFSILFRKLTGMAPLEYRNSRAAG
jgi:two-component system response regulator YesN